MATGRCVGARAVICDGIQLKVEMETSFRSVISNKNVIGCTHLESEDSAFNESHKMFKLSADAVQQDKMHSRATQEIKQLNSEETLINSLGPESRAVVDNLIDNIKTLSVLQRMLLYLKLPTTETNSGDPLRRPLNPMGNRLEVSQALAYIKTHFVPDPNTSLPKREIYNEYLAHCSQRKLKSLSIADFGKAMKQVYPIVRPRRLGERGKSRYCYAGLGHRKSLTTPSTPRESSVFQTTNISTIICDWASKILNVPVNTLPELCKVVSTGTSCNGLENIQASVMCSLPEQSEKLEEQKVNLEVNDGGTSETCSGKRNGKSKQQQSKRQKTCSTKDTTVCAQSLVSIKNTAGCATGSDKSVVCDITNPKVITVDMLGINNTCINSFDLMTEQQSTNVKKRKKAISVNYSTAKKKKKSRKSSDTTRLLRYKSESPKIKFKPQPTEEDFGTGIASVEDLIEVRYVSKTSFEKQTPVKLSSKALTTSDNSRSNDFIHKVNLSTESSEAQDCDQTDMYSDIGYLNTEGLGHYLQDEGNSQEPEEELLKYFKESTNCEMKEYSSHKDMSQLRLLLEQDLPEDVAAKYSSKPSERDTGFREENNTSKTKVDLKNCLITTLDQSLQHTIQKSTVINNSNSKRRVSFENIPDSITHSPHPNRKNFSFTPISPRPQTVSKSTVNVSPFVFPRETIFRGKLSNVNVGCNSQQNLAPSPILQGTSHIRVHMSPLKSLSRSTSLSSTPSPITNSRSSSNIVLKGRSTPQDTGQEQTDSVKSSPLISPNSSSGVFLSPGSPMSSCNSPVFTFRKSMSPVKQADDSKHSAKSNSSLLQSLLMTGKCPDILPQNANERKSDLVVEGDQTKIEPLAVDVCQFSHEGLFPFRSQSVPNFINNDLISPSSKTLPFPVSSLKSREISPLLDIKASELDEWDSVLDGYKSTVNDLLIADTSDPNAEEDDTQTVGNRVSVESVISNLYDILNDKGFSGTDENTRTPTLSRSHPNIPLVYNECSNSSRDPVVSAFPFTSSSKSYPSTPVVSATQTFNSVSTVNNSSAKRNIIPLLDNLSIPAPVFSDDIELQLNTLGDLSGCDDAFNELEREVHSNEFAENCMPS